MALELAFRFPLPKGLHARPASIIQEIAERFAADILFENLRNELRADVKSVLSLVATDTQIDDPCRIVVSGPSEDEAYRALRGLIPDELLRREKEADAAEPAVPPEIPRVLALERAVFYQGLAAGPGVARERVLIHDPVFSAPAAGETRPARPPEEEAGAWREAARALEADLRRGLDGRLNETEKAVLKAHLAIVRDPAFGAKVLELIGAEKIGAAEAVSRAARVFSDMLLSGRSLYLRERMADIRDVARQLIAKITGAPVAAEIPALERRAILVAEDLAPSAFLALDRTYLAGLVLENAGPTSHTLIMCRARGIPAATGFPGLRQKLEFGEDVILDGGRGLLVPSPGPVVARYYEREAEANRARDTIRRTAAALTGRTADGRRIEIAANLGDPEELEAALRSGAEGVGLFRTEFLLMGRDAAPGEEEQYAVYARLARESAERPVIVRTFDIGGDKPVPFLPLPQERNPFLGFRGIRIYEQYSGLIRDQLRAILRAAALGPLKIMFPMVSGVDEVAAVSARLREIAASLAAEGVAHRFPVETGMMVEVPSAALLIDRFSENVDFFSVGTNDLLQYFFAADRGNPAVRALNEPLEPAFLRLLDRIVSQAHAHGRWVGLCGEIAGSTALLPLLAGLGFDELSMNPAAVPDIKARLNALDAAACRALVDEAMDLARGREVAALLEGFRSRTGRRPLVDAGMIRLPSDSRSKAEAIQELAAMMEASGRVECRAEIEQALWKREDTEGGVDLGMGFAIPHCETTAISSPVVGFLRFETPFVWGPEDNPPVDMALMLAFPPRERARTELNLLALLSRRLVHPEFRTALREAVDADAVIHLIAAAVGEEEHRP